MQKFLLCKNTWACIVYITYFKFCKKSVVLKSKTQGCQQAELEGIDPGLEPSTRQTLGQVLAWLRKARDCYFFCPQPFVQESRADFTLAPHLSLPLQVVLQLHAHSTLEMVLKVQHVHSYKLRWAVMGQCSSSRGLKNIFVIVGQHRFSFGLFFLRVIVSCVTVYVDCTSPFHQFRLLAALVSA